MAGNYVTPQVAPGAINPGMMYPGGPQGDPSLSSGAGMQPIGGSGTGTPPDWFSTLTGLAAGAYGLSQSINQTNNANTVLAQSNPFGPYRAGYGAELLGLMQNPSSVTQQPGYQFLLNQGVSAIDRSAAAPGGVGFGSGGEGAQLMQYGQGLADQFYNQQVQLLSSLAGANISPASPYQGLLGTAGAATSTGQSVMGLANNARNLYNLATGPSSVPGGAPGGGGYLDYSAISGGGADLGNIGSAGSGGMFDYSSLLGSGGAADAGSTAVDLTGLFGPSAAGGAAATGTGVGTAGVGGGALGAPGIGAELAGGESGIPLSGAGVDLGAVQGTAGGSSAAAGGLGAGAGAAAAILPIAAVTIAGQRSSPVVLNSDYWNRFRSSLFSGTSGNATYDQYDPAGQQEAMAQGTLYSMLRQQFAGQGGSLSGSWNIPSDLMQYAVKQGMLNADGSFNTKWQPTGQYAFEAYGTMGGGGGGGGTATSRATTKQD